MQCHKKRTTLEHSFMPSPRIANCFHTPIYDPQSKSFTNLTLLLSIKKTWLIIYGFVAYWIPIFGMRHWESAFLSIRTVSSTPTCKTCKCHRLCIQLTMRLFWFYPIYLSILVPSTKRSGGKLNHFDKGSDKGKTK